MIEVKYSCVSIAHIVTVITVTLLSFDPLFFVYRARLSARMRRL